MGEGAEAALQPAARIEVAMSRKGLLAGVFLALCLFVGLSSMYDAYLNVKYPVVAAAEENPIARWILEAHADADDARSALIGAKLVGTLLVVGILATLFALRRTRDMAWSVAASLAVFQCGVLAYMTDGFRYL